MNYTLNQLEIFTKIVQTNSVTRAAEELHLSQPAVSIQLKNFQDQFDTPLTEVVGRKIYITDFGHEIAQVAEQILLLVHNINYKKMDFDGKLTGRLKISIVSTASYIMPYFLSDFLNLNPGVELIMDVTNKSGVLKNLENNEVDFGLVSILPQTLNVEHLKLLQNKLYLVGDSKSTFNKVKNSLKLYSELNLIFREPGSGTRQTMENYFLKNNLSILKKMELTSNEAIKQAVMAGIGYSILPLIGIKNELSNNALQIIPIKGLPIKSNWNLVWMKGKKHSPISLTYLNYLEKEKENIIQNKFSWYEDY